MKIVARIVAGGYVAFVVQDAASAYRPSWFVALLTVPFIFAWAGMWEK